jgi:subtilisin family serine protease
VSEATTLAATLPPGAVVVPTSTLVVEGAKKAELKKLKSEFGAEVLREGSQGKVLLRVPEAGAAGIQAAAAAARTAFERGGVASAQPNFVRILARIRRAAPGNRPLWNHANDGNPGVPGADVAAQAAWTITRGTAAVRIAVLDEGVDVGHPALQAAVVAQRDFVDGNPTAMPDGDDAHGTSCAGIVLSRDAKHPGLAPECSLVAARIAKGDGNDDWVFDDFATADAIDWCWDAAKSDVLSCSWGGGPAVDVISRAFERARTRGRGGKGCVLAIATGNEDSKVGYPATLPNVLAVGASNQWDERKSKATKDGETWWGSNHGTGLTLLAPGVKIAAADIRGSRGYNRNGDFVLNFNGTSSATPHVAAAAALILSVVPQRSEAQVRAAILAGVDRLVPGTKWDKYVGWGRLNAFSALRAARR